MTLSRYTTQSIDNDNRHLACLCSLHGARTTIHFLSLMLVSLSEIGRSTYSCHLHTSCDFHFPRDDMKVPNKALDMRQGEADEMLLRKRLFVHHVLW